MLKRLAVTVHMYIVGNTSAGAHKEALLTQALVPSTNPSSFSPFSWSSLLRLGIPRAFPLLFAFFMLAPFSCCFFLSSERGVKAGRKQIS